MILGGQLPGKVGRRRLLILYGSMVKRLRHRPFTAVTRVQFPVESPTHARVAELADALDLGSSGRPWGFKSLRAHQFEEKAEISAFFLLYDGHAVNLW